VWGGAGLTNKSDRLARLPRCEAGLGCGSFGVGGQVVINGHNWILLGRLFYYLDNRT
jgi:hypothetical protein